MEAGGKKTQYKRGLWTVEEDRILMDYIKVHGKGKWNQVAKVTGLKRCGKSCRLRWMNYLSPSVKRGDFSEEENDLIIRLHKLLGNRWSLIAGRVPGRTDNQVKNHWNTHLSKKLGVKKGKSRVGASSSSFSRNLEETFTNQSSSNNVPPPHFADEPTTDNKVVMMEGGANDQDGEGLIAAGGCSTQGLTMSHDQNSFWFSCNDNYYVHSPNLLDFLDYESFDSVWRGL